MPEKLHELRPRITLESGIMFWMIERDCTHCFACTSCSTSSLLFRFYCVALQNLHSTTNTVLKFSLPQSGVQLMFLHGGYHHADMDALATRTQWSHTHTHKRYHRADMDALVTRTLSSCGHGCSGHSLATKPRSVVNTDVSVQHPQTQTGKAYMATTWKNKKKGRRSGAWNMRKT